MTTWRSCCLMLAFVLAALANPALAGTDPTLAVIDEDFARNPLTASYSQWQFRGGWAWKRAGRMVSSPSSTSLALHRMRRIVAGTMTGRVKLISGGIEAPGATIVFAYRNRPRVWRYVTILAGQPGTVIVGQEGTIGSAPSFRVERVLAQEVPTGTWLDLRVDMIPEGGLTVLLGPAGEAGRLVYADLSLPHATGRIGFRSVRQRTLYDSFRLDWRADIREGGCLFCHGSVSFDPDGSGPQPAAPRVAARWFGSFANRQDGGHGDTDGRSAVDCLDCHDISKPAGTHLDGVHNSVGETAAKGNRNANTAHLRDFFFGAGTEPWSVQLTFDNACATRCHPAAGVYDMRHPRHAPPIAPFGPYNNGDGLAVPWPVDCDLTTDAPLAPPRYAPCVSCHNPHGTATTNTQPSWDGSHESNFMLRGNWMTETTEFCGTCH
jgi:hypothetical protein